MDLKNRVKAAISHFVDTGLAFTLLDISNRVKQDGYGFVRHRDVRPVALDVLDNQLDGLEDYISTSIQVDTPKGIAYSTLYHLEDSDPDEYVNRQQKALTPSEIKPDVTITTKDTSIFVQPTDKTQITPGSIFITAPKFLKKSVILQTPNNLQANAHIYKTVPVRKHDGAVQIPLEVMNESGITPGLRVEVISHPNSISIIPSSDLNERFMHNNFRISKQMLAKSNLGNSDTVNIAVFTNKIVIA